MKTIKVKIDGMGCENCKKHIEEYLNGKEGISAKVSLEEGTVTIECDDSITLDDIEKYIDETGYTYVGVEE